MDIVKLYYKCVKGEITVYLTLDIHEANRYKDKGYQLKRIW